MCGRAGQKGASLTFYLIIEKDIILLNISSDVLLPLRRSQLLPTGYPPIVSLGHHEPIGYPCHHSGQQQLLHICPSETAVLTRPFLSHVRRCEDALYRLSSL